MYSLTLKKTWVVVNLPTLSLARRHEDLKSLVNALMTAVATHLSSQDCVVQSVLSTPISSQHHPPPPPRGVCYCRKAGPPYLIILLSIRTIWTMSHNHLFCFNSR